MMMGMEKQPEIMENTQAMIPTLTPLSIVANIQAYTIAISQYIATCLMTYIDTSIYIYTFMHLPHI